MDCIGVALIQVFQKMVHCLHQYSTANIQVVLAVTFRVFLQITNVRIAVAVGDKESKNYIEGYTFLSKFITFMNYEYTYNIIQKK